MKTWKEQVDALKGKFQSKITAESTQEQIDEVNDYIAEIDTLDTAYNELAQEHAKTKEALVRMVVNQGSSDKPGDDSTGSKPKSMEECVAEELAKQPKKEG